jgi:two-component system NtrC family sensor kinase
VEGIDLAVRRGERVARQLLAFTRTEPMRGEVVDLRDAVQGMLSLLEKSLQGSYWIALELAPEPCPVLVDIADLELALLNLLTNARDAMPDGGSIRVSVAPEPGGTGAPGRIVLGVHDTGSGMLPEVQQRAFEPFYTTKSIGKGTGLGLSSVYGFARQSGGTARIESRDGQGTSVLLALPVSQQGPAKRLSVRENGMAPPQTRVMSAGPGTRVLVVEDDVLVRMVTIEAVEEAGYEVTAAENGADALSVLEREGGLLAAVVTDVAMPGVGGIEVARRIKRDWPHLALILTTGYTADAIPVEEMPASFAFVPKPFSTDDLVRRLAALLDGAAATNVRPA